jgi:hypothetical protein
MGGSLPPFFMEFNFQFGKKPKTIFRYAIIGVVFTSLVAGVSQCTHIPEERIYDIVDQVQRKLPGKPLNDYIINDPVLLDRRVHRDVDRAISDYERLTGDDGSAMIRGPKLVERPPDGSKAQELLGGEMRLCAPWVDDCPKE